MKESIINTIKITAGLMLIAIAVSLFADVAQASAAQRLSVMSDKAWINGTGNVIVTCKNHKDGEELSVSAKSSKSVKIKVGKWNNDICVIRLTAKADKNTTLNISLGSEKISVKLYLTKDKELTGEEMYRYLRKAMVEIKCTDSVGSVYIGSGFFVGNGLVLTNSHVTEAASDISIYDYDGKKYEVKEIVGEDTVKDLILIRVKTGNKGALSMATSAPGGAKIYNIGSPAGLTGSFVTGLVANEGYDIEGTHYIQLSMPTGIGSGGGPVVNTHGQVLGVMTLVVNAAQNITMAVDYSEINNFLNRLTPADAMSLDRFYAKTRGRTKESNDHKIFENFTDENTSKTYGLGQKELTQEEIYALAKKACVDITITFDMLGHGVIGSGFFIDEETIVTNHHVVEDALSGNPVVSFEIADYFGNKYVLNDRIKYNELYDVAILTVRPAKSGTKHGVFELAVGYIPEVGERLYGMGRPAGYSCTFSEGITIMSQRSLEGVVYINSSVPITGGSSGGPLINKYGKVIGINSRVINVVKNSNISVLIGYIQKAS